MSDHTAQERLHQDAWYTQAIRDRFFDREGFRRLRRWNMSFLRRAVPLTRASRVLSLGCGTGEYERMLAPEVGRVVAIDLSPVAIHEARQLAERERLTNLEFHEASIFDAVFDAGSFDVVYALGVLHHLSLAERHTLLIRIRQWLPPGGWLYARDPNARGILRRLASRRFRDPLFHSPNEAALDPRELCQEVMAAGFRDADVGYTDVIAGPLPWLVASSSRLLWSAVFLFDRVWLTLPGVRRLASQFELRASR